MKLRSFLRFWIPAFAGMTLCVSILQGADISVGTPAVENSSSPFSTLPKFFVPSGGWDTSISTGRQMYWDGSNWWVRITTNDPAAPIEGNDYNYNYVLQVDANDYTLEQTTIPHKVSVPLYSSTDTTRIIRVNDTFGNPTEPLPPNTLSASRFTNNGGFTGTVVALNWNSPQFATKVGTSPLSTLNSSNIQNLSIQDLFLYQVLRTTVPGVDANVSTAPYVQVGNAMPSDTQFLDNTALPGVTYYYVMRSVDAYLPPDMSVFTSPVQPVDVILVNVILTVDVSKVSGVSNGVFVTVHLPGQASNILTRAPLTYNGDGTWSISFLNTNMVTGQTVLYRYIRNTAQGDVVEPDQPNTATGDHQFYLDSNNPMMDTSTVPYVVRINDMWGIPTFSATPMGLPRIIASISVSSSAYEVGVGSGDRINYVIDQAADDSRGGHTGLSCAGSLVWYSSSTDPNNPGTYYAVPNPALPNVKVFFGTSTDTGAPLWDVSKSTAPGYTVTITTVTNPDTTLAYVPDAPCHAFGQPVVKVFVKSGSSLYKLQTVDFSGNLSGRPSLPFKPGDSFPMWVDISTKVQFTNTLTMRNGPGTGIIAMNWMAPPSISTTTMKYGPAHHYDVRYATFPIVDLTTLKMSKMAGRISADMPGSGENFATINMGDSSPGYYFVLVPLYDDWSSVSGCKIVMQFGKMGVAPKLLNISARTTDRSQRRAIKGAPGPTDMGRVDISAVGSDADVRAGIEIPRSGIDLSQAMAVVKNARETGDDTDTAGRVAQAVQEAQTTTRRISNSLASLNVVGSNASQSSVVSYQVSDLAGNNYFVDGKTLAKIPLVISVPIPKNWSTFGDGIIDVTRGTAKPVKLSDLHVYRLNTKGNFWEPVDEGMQAVDLANGVVRAEVKHLSTFALFAAGGSAGDLSNAVVYPNPFVPASGNPQTGSPWTSSDPKSGIIFDNLTANSEVFIYTLAMDLVKRHKLAGANFEEQNGKWRWDGRNDSGDSVASGLYIYMVKDDSISGTNRKTGKLVIVR